MVEKYRRCVFLLRKSSYYTCTSDSESCCRMHLRIRLALQVQVHDFLALHNCVAAELETPFQRVVDG